MNPLNFVYVCRSGENEELRYSIRSIFKFYPDANIWVVGQKPNWYSGPFIEVLTDSIDKHQAVYHNLKTIAHSSELPENIIIMNDDFFFIKRLQPIDYYFSGKLSNKVRAYEILFPESSYTKRLKKCHTYLRNNHIARPLDYELHVPMKVRRDKLGKAIEHNIPWRSAYGNLFKVRGQEMKDIKVYGKDSNEFNGYDYKAEAYPFLSTNEESFDEIKDDYLINKFPNPSPYESDIL